MFRLKFLRIDNGAPAKIWIRQGCDKDKRERLQVAGMMVLGDSPDDIILFINAMLNIGRFAIVSLDISIISNIISTIPLHSDPDAQLFPKQTPFTPSGSLFLPFKAIFDFPKIRKDYYMPLRNSTSQPSTLFLAPKYM